MEGKGTRLRLRGGTWYVVWTGNSRGTSTRTGSRQEAEQFLATFIQQRDKQDEIAGTGLTVSQMMDDYITEHVKAKDVVSREQIEIARNYLNVHFPVGTLAVSVTEDDVGAYMAARREGRLKIARDPKPAGDGTLRRELGTLSAAFNHAIRKKRLAPGSKPHISPPPPPAPRDLWLDADQEKALLAAMPQPAEGADRLSRVYRFVLLALDTAARKEALETLTWLQVDFAAGIINLNPRGRIQTKKRRPVVPMSARLRTVLERAFREKQTGWVLDNAGSIRTSMETLTAKARMEWLTPHVFRHTWATRAARAGVDMVDIADFLGDDLRTVEKNYRHHSPHFLRGAADWREREAPTAPADRKEQR